MQRAPVGRPYRIQTGTASGFGLGPAFHFAINGLAAGDLRRGNSTGRSVAAFTHAVLETAHGAAQIRADVAQFLGAEYQHYDDQNDQPVPDAERAHRVL